MTSAGGERIRLVPYGRAALEALRVTLAEAKAGDPLAPVTVAVPGNYAGLAARRWLARRGLEDGAGGGLLNVRFIVLARVAELLGAPRLAAQGRRPLTEPYRHEAVRAALRDAPGVFADVSDEAATWRALERTFRELDGCDEAHLDALAARGGRAADVVAVFRAYRRRVAGFYDEGDLARAAAEAVRAGDAALGDIGAVVLYLPGRLAAAERALVEALGDAGRLRAVVGLTGDATADAALLDAWGADGDVPDGAPAIEPPVGTRVVAGTDPEEEVRAAVREIAARAREGTPLHRMAVLYRHAEPYARIVAEQLGAAGLPWNGPGLVRLSQTVAGRTLLGFLELAEQDFRREAVTAWLSAAPVLEHEGDRAAPAPSHRWDAIARSAHVVRRLEQWWGRLAAYTKQLERERERHEAEGRATGWVDADLQQTGRLLAFMEELASRARPPDETWSGLARWAGGALTRYLGGVTRLRGEEERTWYERVSEALDELGGLDDVGGAAPGLAAFRAALERSLDRPAGRSGRFGEGVFAGRFADAGGGDFDVVFLLGMNEGSVPPSTREDPLLPDAERAATGGAMPLRRAQAADERRAYLAALASAPERVLSYARGDLRAQRERLPSRWVVETARALAGGPVFASTLGDHAGSPWFPSSPSFEAALLGEGEPASALEYDLRSLSRRRRARGDVAGHYLLAEHRALRDGLEAQRARRGRRLGRWNGLAAPPPERSPFSGGGAVSPTALQDYAECPFRFLLGRVLYVTGVEEPDEDEIAISALEKGSVVHRVLDRFLREVPRRTRFDQPWSAEERRRLLAIGEEECDAAEREGRTGRALLWEVERSRILEDLERWLDADEGLRDDLKTVTVATEMRFGMTGDEPVEVDAGGGRRVALRGVIDRVDRTAGGSLVVIDYKTGSPYSYRNLDEDPVARGTRLQLPVYAAAAERRWSGAPSVAAYYWFVHDEAGFVQHGYEVGERQREAFRETLEVIADGVEAGVFPARPGVPREVGWVNCAYCAYDPLCASDRARAWERVREDPRLATYVRLAEEERA